jgi:rare lipoprotein A
MLICPANPVATSPRRAALLCAAAAFLALFAAGCGHKAQQSRQTAPPVTQYPPADSGAVGVAPAKPAPGKSNSGAIGRIPPTPAPAGGVDQADLDFIAGHQPIQSEEGLATWYTAPYKGRKSANGQVFSDDALTAAHRTLPMGSLVVVTNLKTGQSSAMRITDRGPFVEGRILDLTMASARATGIYRAGLAQVRMDVYRTPKPIETGGRWCVQIGAFREEHDALKLEEQLESKYPDASIIEFPGQSSFWVRIRPAGDNREQAELIARRLKLKEGDAFLTRLD